ncbi:MULTISPECIES: riboflavin synthase [Reichenbachiella]|uniref:Riboflavin synthase n=1 Tax=Reichenbachiella agariperforans TaxID=156994 RepID=A0A1M6L6I4_REIAG|nr:MULTISPECIES: riboflavin synthase [Reichenbachiella]RJE74270.1 riboflavin synthase subunit alpha [Reichenbachiella sp. MSK19-1]SHJ66782.1 riboflavin synthase alpha chain [Reichenbachiella agariperforans]
MFTGIIETLGKVIAIEKEGSNLHFTLESPLSHELKIDQSVAHNGVCLTVVKMGNGTHTVTAVDETLKKTNLKQLEIGHEVNLERCMIANGRFDGHVVQGHVDQTAVCTAKTTLDGSWIFDFEYDAALGNVTVEKGSICINGVSLTCFKSGTNTFSVTIIPYTMEHTDFKQLESGDEVNLEFDIIGKYVSKLLNNR